MVDISQKDTSKIPAIDPQEKIETAKTTIPIPPVMDPIETVNTLLNLRTITALVEWRTIFFPICKLTRLPNECLECEVDDEEPLKIVVPIDKPVSVTFTGGYRLPFTLQS